MLEVKRRKISCLPSSHIPISFQMTQNAEKLRIRGEAWCLGPKRKGDHESEGSQISTLSTLELSKPVEDWVWHWASLSGSLNFPFLHLHSTLTLDIDVTVILESLSLCVVHCSPLGLDECPASGKVECHLLTKHVVYSCALPKDWYMTRRLLFCPVLSSWASLSSLVSILYSEISQTPSFWTRAAGTSWPGSSFEAGGFLHPGRWFHKWVWATWINNKISLYPRWVNSKSTSVCFRIVNCFIVCIISRA